MARTLVRIVSESGDTLYLDEALSAVAYNGQDKPLDGILGLGDVELDVPRVGQRTELPNGHRGFCVERLDDSADEYRFRILPTGTIVSIDKIFTNREEEDYSQRVVGMAYLGVGGVALLTDEMELHCAFGPDLDTQTFLDLGYDSTGNLRAYSSKNPCDHIRSFSCRKGRYYLVNDLDYVIISNASDFPGRMQGEPAPHSFCLYKVGVNEPVSCIEEPFKPSNNLVRISRAFLNLLPIELSQSVYVFQGDEKGKGTYMGPSGKTVNGKINVFELLTSGTGEDTVVKAKEVEVASGETAVTLVEV